VRVCLRPRALFLLYLRLVYFGTCTFFPSVFYCSRDDDDDDDDDYDDDDDDNDNYNNNNNDNKNNTYTPIYYLLNAFNNSGPNTKLKCTNHKKSKTLLNPLSLKLHMDMMKSILLYLK
jgi:hypothetical protein